MTIDSVMAADQGPEMKFPDGAPGTKGPRKWPSLFSFNNIGAVYVLLIQIVIFGFWIPDIFLNKETFFQILNNNAIIGLAALAIIVPLAAGVFDLSFAHVMSLSGVITAYMVSNYQWQLVPAIALALAASVLVGFVNAIVVVTLRVESLIGTLATGSLIMAFVTMVTNDQLVTSAELLGPFSAIGQTQVLGGITLPVIYMFIVGALLWFLLEHTPTGRRLYAVGFNSEASRLAGIPVKRLQFRSLLVSAFMAGFTGIVLASYLGSGNPTGGTPYLLPAFAAVFLGATQFKHGRFNAWGTIVAVLMLGTGITGLALAAAPAWAADLFTGIVLIAALAYPAGNALSLRGIRTRIASVFRRSPSRST